jgi:hypothetical protein
MTYSVSINQCKRFAKNLAKASSLLIAMVASTAQAIPEQCVRMPTQTNVCEHVIYKTVRNLNANSIVGDGDVYCVCLQDFSHLILPGETIEEREQQKLDIENITRILDVTEQQLLRLIRY